MKARPRDARAGVPAALWTFTEADWPGDTLADRLEFWVAERMAWSLANGWPGGGLGCLRGITAARAEVDAAGVRQDGVER